MDQGEKIKYIYDEIQNNNVDNDYIIKYIHLKNIKYTENNNGIFINLTDLNIITINKLEAYIEYVNEQLNELSNIETEKNNIKNEFFKQDKKNKTTPEIVQNNVKQLISELS